ncbi:MAG: GNAT family N-acetyltransferase [Alphaproteobacteria bacterium]|jgi:putative hemolysin
MKTGTVLDEISPPLSVRLAESQTEIEAAQRLRYQVFYDEMRAIPTRDMAREKRDFDDFDAVADHLLVIDETKDIENDRIVGTYRLIRRDAARAAGGFYSAREFDIRSLVAQDGEILELGRSCVAAPYRTRSVMQHLWRGIAAYVFRYDVQLMFGCASLPGIDTGMESGAVRLVLSYLHHRKLAPAALRPQALASQRALLALMDAAEINDRAALRHIPPLLKGYLFLGGSVGEGAVIDRQFNTTDVCVVLPVDRITRKYYDHYKRTAQPDAHATGTITD